MVCTIDDIWREIEARRDRRAQIKEQRGADLDVLWTDLGGEG